MRGRGGGGIFCGITPASPVYRSRRVQLRLQPQFIPGDIDTTKEKAGDGEEVNANNYPVTAMAKGEEGDGRVTTRREKGHTLPCIQHAVPSKIEWLTNL